MALVGCPPAAVAAMRSEAGDGLNGRRRLCGADVVGGHAARWLPPCGYASPSDLVRRVINVALVYVPGRAKETSSTTSLTSMFMRSS
jgi:hypothetical protein